MPVSVSEAPEVSVASDVSVAPEVSSSPEVCVLVLESPVPAESSATSGSEQAANNIAGIATRKTGIKFRLKVPICKSVGPRTSKWTIFSSYLWEFSRRPKHELGPQR